MKYTCAACALLTGMTMWTASTAVGTARPTSPTTIYLVRHAEKKSEDRDPELSPAGSARAAYLAWMLEHVRFDAVYASDFKRTRDTVAGIARKHGVEITSYDPHGNLAETLRTRHGGQTVLVAGHSNTIPAALAQFGVPIDEDILAGYDDLFIVTLAGPGPTGDPIVGLQRLRYAAPGGAP